jgi:hypothetical protein
VLAAACLLAVIVDGVQRSLPTGELRDFGSFVASGQAGTRGEDPYGIHPLTFHVVLPGFDVWNPNLNPPISVPMFRAFGVLPPQQAFRYWWGFSFVCYLLTVALLIQRYGGRDVWLLSLWAFALAGFWDTLALGQIYTPLVLAATVSWLLLERRHWLVAGVLMGAVVAMKPNFVVWPAALLLAGHVRAPLAAAAATIVLAVIPVLTHGAGIYVRWAAVILADESRTAFLTNASIPGLAQRLGFAPLGIVCSLLIVAAIAWWAYRRRPSVMEASAIGILGGIAASPIAWVHYTLFLLPVFFRLRTSAPLLPAALLLVIPVAVVLRFLDAPMWQQATIGSSYNWAVVVLLAVLARRESRVSLPACRSAPETPGRQVPV